MKLKQIGKSSIDDMADEGNLSRMSSSKSLKEIVITDYASHRGSLDSRDSPEEVRTQRLEELGAATTSSVQAEHVDASGGVSDCADEDSECDGD